MLFAFPRQAAVNRVIPKTKLYEHGDANAALRGLFVDQVTKVTLTHVLNHDSTNLPSAGGIDEIDIFRIDARLSRPQDLDQRVLRCCDRVIPRPTLFEIHADSGVQLTAQLKFAQAKLPPSAAASGQDPTRTKVSTGTTVASYLWSPVIPTEAPRQPLPLVTTLLALYERLLESLLDLERHAQESITDTVRRRHDLGRLDQRIATLRKRMNAELQFNRRVDLNAELRDLESQRHSFIAKPT